MAYFLRVGHSLTDELLNCCLLLQSYEGEEEAFPGPQGINVGSFPKDFRYGGPDEYDSEAAGGPSADNKPRILLMGRQR